MQILGLLGMYFDAAIVEVETFLLLFRLALWAAQFFSEINWLFPSQTALGNQLAKVFIMWRLVFLSSKVGQLIRIIRSI